MDKVEDQHLHSYAPIPTTQAAKRSKRSWILGLLAGMLVIGGLNLCGVLKSTSWEPHTGCGKGRLHTKPASHYTLPSGDKIPSVALGGSAQ